MVHYLLLLELIKTIVVFPYCLRPTQLYPFYGIASFNKETYYIGVQDGFRHKESMHGLTQSCQSME